MSSYFLASTLIFGATVLASRAFGADAVKWDQLPPLPDKEGFAGMYAGVSGGALVAAGGTNFPDNPPWKGGTKTWYDKIYVLDRPDGDWRIAAEKLPRPLAYGVSATWQDSVICVGGGDRDRHYADVFQMKLSDGRIQFESLPSLPKKCASACGGIVGTKLYIAGGTDDPAPTKSLKNFWCLDLVASKTDRRWQQLEPWPGPERSDAVAAVLDGSFFVISGVQWQADSAGQPQRIAPFLTDAYRYTPDSGGSGSWQRIADIPRAVVAAPSPAMALAKRRFIIAGGVDHVIGDAEPATHPGFDRDVFAYDLVANKWSSIEPLPVGASRVCVPTTVWNGQYALIAGERAPGRRSPAVFTLSRDNSAD